MKQYPPCISRLQTSSPRALNRSLSLSECVDTDDSVELGAFVALGPLIRSLGLASAELAEILSRLGADVFEELKGDAAEGFA